MLGSRERGYAVMNKDLSGYSFSHADFETCKRYCYGTDVIVERIPTHRGWRVEFFWEPFRLRIYKAYLHRNGEIVYNQTT